MPLLLCLLCFPLLLALPVRGARPDPPSPPSTGAIASGVYRNVFVEAGYAAADVDARLTAIVQQLFFGHPANESLLYPSTDASANASYIWDVADNDVRTEGMSYGLMATVQLGLQREFDQLLRWVITYMRHPPGNVREGYSSWHCQPSGGSMDDNPASDGETFTVTALLFAAARWGDAGAFNYSAQAALVLRAMVDKEDPPCGVQGCQSVTNMFGSVVDDATPPLVVFVPYASAAGYTDPSYVTPHFYELWAEAAACGNMSSYWRGVANASRAFFHAAAHPVTSLTPDYATFAGEPTGSGQSFSFDAWRTVRNVAVDYAWYAADEWGIGMANRLLTFFRGLPSWPAYGNQFDIDGRQTDGDHSPGLVAMNAVGVLASNLTLAWDFIDALWNTSTPSDRFRYYDGVLYLEAWLHLSGKYRAWSAGSGGRRVVISNIAPRLDTAGRVVNAHDGSLLLAPDGRFYLFGTHYLSCDEGSVGCANKSCGWFGNTYAVYSSSDLSSGSWVLESANILPAMAADNDKVAYFEPNVLYNVATATFVLEYAGQVGEAEAAMAVSRTPIGPFTPIAPLKLAHREGSTSALWLDPATGAGYVRYNSGGAMQCVELLSPDFTTATGNVSCAPFAGEGGGLFRRGDTVYLMAGTGCCFCAGGGSAEVWASTTGPLGVYTRMGNVNQQTNATQCGAAAEAAAEEAAAARAALAARAATVARAQHPTSVCNLTGGWRGYDAPQCPHGVTVNVTMVAGGGGAFTATSSEWGAASGNGSVAEDGVVVFDLPGGERLAGLLRAYAGGSDACSEVAWAAPASFARSRWCAAGVCAATPAPAYAIAAQQFQVLSIPQAGGAGDALIFFGERWQSAPSGRKSDDAQAWQPLTFAPDGSVEDMGALVNNFTLLLPQAA